MRLRGRDWPEYIRGLPNQPALYRNLQSTPATRPALLRFFGICAVLFLSPASLLQAQAPAAPPAVPDVLVLKDGEKVIGQLQSATDKTVAFKSDALGVVNVDWSKVAELHSSHTFAAIPKGVRLKTVEDEAKVTLGTVEASDQKIELSPGAPPAPIQTVAPSSISNLVAEPDFRKALRPAGIFSDWVGSATAGISVTRATQDSQNYTGALTLVRAIPAEGWLDPRSRTVIDVNEAYGEVTQPGTPTIKTAISHGDAQQSWYRSPRFFVFVSAALDHNFSQGLSLQQNYGLGVGWVPIKDGKQELDLTASGNYIDQQFAGSASSQDLIGSSFGDTYTRKLPRKIVLTQLLTVTPTWNVVNDYSAVGSFSLTFPIFHRFGLSTAVLDNYLNDPPPGFRKNSFQFTLGATYSFQ